MCGSVCPAEGMASTKAPKKVLASNAHINEAKLVLQGEWTGGRLRTDGIRHAKGGSGLSATSETSSHRDFFVHTASHVVFIMLQRHPLTETYPLLSDLSWSSYGPCVVSPWDLWVLGPCCGDWSHSVSHTHAGHHDSWIVLFPFFSPHQWIQPKKDRSLIFPLQSPEMPILKSSMEK